MPIPEELLHFIWRFRLYNAKELRTTAGDTVRVIDPGQYNHDAGPDFEFAKLRIGDTLWSGHVEIHVDARDWHHHKHHLDPNYNSTVLHVVWTGDVDAQRLDGTRIVTVALNQCVETIMISKYEELMHNLHWIPCEKQVSDVSTLTKNTWLERMAVERLESKYRHLNTLLKKSKNHWEKVLLVSLGRSFGMKVNAQAFEDLLQQIDISLLQKYHNNPTQLEALLFGTSGLLPKESNDDYVKRLLNEYAYLKKIHGLGKLSPTEWKFHRMRPYNFPTFRLAQLTALYHHEVYWFDTILKTDQLHDIRQRLRGINIHPYWSRHFRFNQQTSPHTSHLSDTFINHIVINCFAPILFAYGKFVDNEVYKAKAIEWLEQTKKEVNAITKKFESLGWENRNASCSQGLLHLKKAYCEHKKCLSCAVGLAILR